MRVLPGTSLLLPRGIKPTIAAVNGAAVGGYVADSNRNAFKTSF